MIKIALAGAFCALTASFASAEISLTPPIDCDLGRDCFIQQYVDHDAGTGAEDFRCSNLSYNTHKGTDFALRTYAQMQRGVDVLAAAPGRVKSTRDGEADRLFGGRAREVPSNRACGNGLVIEHEGGWTTQYCHLRKGTLAVQEGQTIDRGEVLGQIGLSGRTQFPHVHMTVRRNNVVVDPFDPDGKITCGVPSEDSLWDTSINYRPGAILDVGFADRVPEFTEIKAGSANQSTLPATAPAIVVFGFAFGGQTGDKVQMKIDAPQDVLIEETVVLKKNQAQFFRAIGKNRTTPAWPKGRYLGTVSLIRKGKVINTERTELRVR